MMLYDQYVMERYKSGLTGKGSTTPNPVVKTSKPKFTKKDFDLPRISELNKEHPARVYLSNRKIPEKCFRDLYYCDKFKRWTNEQKHTFDDVNNDEARVIIPLKNRSRIFGFQGRSLNSKSKLRYITIMLDEDAPKIYGLERINKSSTIHIVEGPFDSLFLENCVAMAGADLDLGSFGWSDYICVYDNEPRSREIVNRISKSIDRGDKVVIWPKSIDEKDLNDMHNAGHDVKNLVESNTYQGLKAKVQLNNWKRI
jgi:hypothetical protein